jgi:hypothetical protein
MHFETLSPAASRAAADEPPEFPEAPHADSATAQPTAANMRVPLLTCIDPVLADGA